MTIFDAQGRERNLQQLSAVVQLETLKQKSGSDPWPVIEQCIEIWKHTRPKEWKSYLVYLDTTKQTRKRTRVGGKTFRGVSTDNEQGGFTSYLMDIPEKVILLIRCMYNADELPMNKEFYRRLGRKFPELVVRESV